MSSSIENSPVEASDPKLLQGIADQSKILICLQCGTIILGDPEKHYKEKGHYIYIREQTLICKKCGYNFKGEDVTEKVAMMLMEVSVALLGKLPKLMTMMTGGKLPGMPNAPLASAPLS